MRVGRDALAFLDYVRGDCAAAGVRLNLIARENTRAGDVGLFDDIKRTLTVCVNDQAWLITLAHEHGHLRQWRERSRLWDPKSTDVEDFEAWLNEGRRISAPKLTSIVRRLQRMELDAERRCLRTVRLFKLTDDVSGMIKSMNLYVWQYEHARRHRKWTEATVKSHPEVAAALPARLISADRVGHLPPELETALFPLG